MLERVGTVAVRSGGGASLTHTAHWVDGPRSGLWGENAVIYKDDSWILPVSFRKNDDSKWRNDNSEEEYLLSSSLDLNIDTY